MERRMKIKITFTVSHDVRDGRLHSGIYFVVGHSCESMKSHYDDLLVFRVTFFSECEGKTAEVRSIRGEGADVNVDSKTFSKQKPLNPLDTFDSCETKIKTT